MHASMGTWYAMLSKLTTRDSRRGGWKPVEREWPDWAVLLTIGVGWTIFMLLVNWAEAAR